MIQLVLGPSGSGKTTRMIDQANEEHKSHSGHLVFVDNDDSQMFRLDHSVRLINMKQYHIHTMDRLYGLLAGMLARDFDIERVFIDGLHAEVLQEGDFEENLKALVTLSSENNADFLIGLNIKPEDIPKVDGIEMVDLWEA
ncbi:hypothetical protein [uncultured Murdochiella sp.]|uniref:ATP-binding protein n=1 Tax=uncultured Murdochiella sp. TaxID=1586095 RepID=UPI0028039274|nr:hypothetical protein [uncultured Murdochiella sp.]